MAEEKIRVGIVGAGGNTRAKHIPGLQAQDDVEVVSVCNRSRESGRKVAEQFGIPKVYEDWQELVAEDDINAVVIGTWPYMHCPITLAALEAGRHVMCEARMAMDAVEAQQMLRAAREHPDLVTQVVPSPFSLHVDQTIRRLVGEGYLGKLLAVRIADHRGSFPDPDAPMQWREDRDKSGLNTMSLGIWYEALMRWVGPARNVTAYADTFVKKRFDPEKNVVRDVDIPDYLEVNGTLECEAALNISLTTASGLAPRRGAWLIGSNGTLAFEGGDLMGGRRGDGGLKPIAPLEGEQAGWRVEEEFTNAIRGQETISLTTFETGLRYMAFTEAVHRSAQSGQTLDIAPFCADLLD
jgi:predicted dehydrogenase